MSYLTLPEKLPWSRLNLVTSSQDDLRQIKSRVSLLIRVATVAEDAAAVLRFNRTPTNEPAAKGLYNASSQ